MSESQLGACSTETFVVIISAKRKESDMLQGIAALLAVSSWSAVAHWVRSDIFRVGGVRNDERQIKH